MAELELSVLARQCLEERLESQDYLGRQVAAWQQARNAVARRVNWRFTAADARLKLKRVYPQSYLEPAPVTRHPPRATETRSG